MMMRWTMRSIVGGTSVEVLIEPWVVYVLLLSGIARRIKLGNEVPE